MNVKGLIASIEDSLEEFVTLEIITAVGTVEPTARDADGKKTKLGIDPGARLLRTRFSLLAGDITTEMDPAFVTGEYQSLQQFHTAREAEAWGIVKSNVEALKSILDLVNTYGDKGAPPDAPK
ncbi:MAG: hypothetical protein ABJE95_37510 [Byssovorax sp.]